MATKVEREIARDNKLNEAVAEIKKVSEKLNEIMEKLNESEKGKKTKKNS